MCRRLAREEGVRGTVRRRQRAPRCAWRASEPPGDGADGRDDPVRLGKPLSRGSLLGGSVIVVPATALDAIRAHAREAYPEECCGGLLGEASGSGIRIANAERIANASREMRERRFAVDPRDYLRLERLADARRTCRSWASTTFASGPSGAPSEYDREHAFPFPRHLIMAVERAGPGRRPPGFFPRIAGVFEREEPWWSPMRSRRRSSRGSRRCPEFCAATPLRPLRRRLRERRGRGRDRGRRAPPPGRGARGLRPHLYDEEGSCAATSTSTRTRRTSGTREGRNGARPGATRSRSSPRSREDLRRRPASRTTRSGATHATSSCRRSGSRDRSGSRRRGSSRSAPAASARRTRCNWRPRASARSGWSTSTSSTTPTCNGRSSTARETSAGPSSRPRRRACGT